jgi:TetR/AcrR family tetracycline transcriptional repressor
MRRDRTSNAVTRPLLPVAPVLVVLVAGAGRERRQASDGEAHTMAKAAQGGGAAERAAGSVGGESGARGLLTRERVLRGALEYVDAHGLDAFSMHKLGASLGVTAMSLYNHVRDKDAILDGIVEVLWAEIEAAQDTGGDWPQALRSLARSVRAVVRRHPAAAPLLLSRRIMPAPALRVCELHLQVLRRATFSEHRAVEVLRAVLAHACGFALAELCWSCGAPPGAGAEAGAQQTDLQRLRRVSQLLPPDVPDRLFGVAVAMCGDGEGEAMFERGLELMLRGLESKGRTAGRHGGARRP